MKSDDKLIGFSLEDTRQKAHYTCMLNTFWIFFFFPEEHIVESINHASALQEANRKEEKKTLSNFFISSKWFDIDSVIKRYTRTAKAIHSISNWISSICSSLHFKRCKMLCFPEGKFTSHENILPADIIFRRETELKFFSLFLFKAIKIIS